MKTGNIASGVLLSRLIYHDSCQQSAVLWCSFESGCPVDCRSRIGSGARWGDQLICLVGVTDENMSSKIKVRREILDLQGILRWKQHIFFLVTVRKAKVVEWQGKYSESESKSKSQLEGKYDAVLSDYCRLCCSIARLAQVDCFVEVGSAENCFFREIASCKQLLDDSQCELYAFVMFDLMVDEKCIASSKDWNTR